MNATKCCGIMTLILMAGCCATFERLDSDSPLFPTLVFQKEWTTAGSGSILEERKEDLTRKYGADNVEKMSLDPFWSQPYQEVLFKTLTPCNEILYYYDCVLRKDGWDLYRGGLGIEENVYGYDQTIRVFRKNDTFIRLHVSAPPTEPEDNYVGRGVWEWNVFFSFVGLETKDFFGVQYRLKGKKERFSEQYHVYVPNLVKKMTLQTAETTDPTPIEKGGGTHEK